MACQIGTAFAARTGHASLRSVGLLTNRLLLWGIAFEIVFAAVVVTWSPLQRVFGTALPDATAPALLLPFPLVVSGADELGSCRSRQRTPARH